MQDAGRDARTWWVACGLLFVTAFGTNVPVPLLLVYRVELDLAASTLAAVFGVYALGLAPSLLLGGPASDRFGRVRVLLPAALGAVGASLLFLGAGSALWLLFAARFVQGLASGAVFSVGSAWLQDLAGTAGAARAARAASIAQTAGFCIGPLTSGLLATYGPWPLTLPYLVHVALMVPAALAAVLVVGVGAAVASGPADEAEPRGLLPRPGLDAPGRRTFARVVVPTAVCVYAFPSVSVTVLPLLLPGASGLVAFTGLLAALTLGTGTLVQPFAHRLGPRTVPVGAGFGALGFAAGTLAAVAPSTGTVAVAGVLLGAGGGLCLNAGLTLVGRLAPASGRGAANGLFYTAAYLGFAAPYLATALVTVEELAGPLLALTAVTVTTASWLAVRTRAGAYAG